MDFATSHDLAAQSDRGQPAVGSTVSIPQVTSFFVDDFDFPVLGSAPMRPSHVSPVPSFANYSRSTQDRILAFLRSGQPLSAPDQRLWDSLPVVIEEACLTGSSEKLAEACRGWRAQVRASNRKPRSKILHKVLSFRKQELVSTHRYVSGAVLAQALHHVLSTPVEEWDLASHQMVQCWSVIAAFPQKTTVAQIAADRCYATPQYTERLAQLGFDTAITALVRMPRGYAFRCGGKTEHEGKSSPKLPTPPREQVTRAALEDLHQQVHALEDAAADVRAAKEEEKPVEQCADQTPMVSNLPITQEFRAAFDDLDFYFAQMHGHGKAFNHEPACSAFWPVWHFSTKIVTESVVRPHATGLYTGKVLRVYASLNGRDSETAMSIPSAASYYTLVQSTATDSAIASLTCSIRNDAGKQSVTSDPVLAATFLVALSCYRHSSAWLDTVLATAARFVPTVGGFYSTSPDCPKVRQEQTPRVVFHLHGKAALRFRQRWGLQGTPFLSPPYCPPINVSTLKSMFGKRLFPEPVYRSPRFQAAIVKAVDYVEEQLLKNAAPPTTLAEIRASIARHCEMKGFDEKDTAKYTAGAEEALSGKLPDAGLRQELHTYKLFIKAECYPQPKPPRAIMVPSMRVRGYTHALEYQLEKGIFPEGGLNRCSIKHLSEKERALHICELFEGKPVVQTDYSSMESCVDAYCIEHIEMKVFCDLAEHWYTGELAPMKPLIKAVWRSYLNGAHIRSTQFSFDLPPMRMSGTDHTSMGNWLCNCVWFVALATLAGITDPLETLFPVFEGDDGIFLDPDEVKKGALEEMQKTAEKEAGIRLKLERFPDYTLASFCGCSGPVIAGVPTLTLDEEYQLQKVCWLVDPDMSTNKHDAALVYSKAVALMLRCQSGRLYDYAAAIAQMAEPAQFTAYDRRSWLRYMYRGEDDTLPELEHLASFIKSHELPDPQPVQFSATRGESQEFFRDLRSTPRSEIEDAVSKTLLDSTLASGSNYHETDPLPAPKGFKAVENPGRGYCGIYSLYDVMGLPHDDVGTFTHEYADLFRKDCPNEPDPFNACGATDDFLAYLAFTKFGKLGVSIWDGGYWQYRTVTDDFKFVGAGGEEPLDNTITVFGHGADGHHYEALIRDAPRSAGIQEQAARLNQSLANMVAHVREGVAAFLHHDANRPAGAGALPEPNAQRDRARRVEFTWMSLLTHIWSLLLRVVLWITHADNVVSVVLVALVGLLAFVLLALLAFLFASGVSKACMIAAVAARHSPISPQLRFAVRVCAAAAICIWGQFGALISLLL